MSSTKVAKKPTVLILGGINTVARHLAVFLCGNLGRDAESRDPLVKFLRIVDKYSVQPATTYIDPAFRQCLADLPDVVEYRQMNLTMKSKVEEAFLVPEDKGFDRFDYVFDLTGETRYDRPEIIHIQQTYTLPFALAKHATSLPKHIQPQAYIRLTFPFYEMKSSSPSTGYGEAFLPNSEDKKRSKGFFGGGKDKDDAYVEGFGMRPDGVRGRWWHEVVRAIGAIGADGEDGNDRLNFAAIRVGEIYGEGYCDQSQVLGRLVVGHIYQYSKEEMKFLYNPDLRMHTIHVQDVVRGLFTAAQWISSLGENARSQADKLAGVSIPSGWYRATETERRGLDKMLKSGDMQLNMLGSDDKVTVPYFNLVDQADTTQDSLARSIASVYRIKYGFHGSIVSTLVSQFQKMDFSEMVDDVNEDHMKIWQKMLEASKPPVFDTPISPYLDDHAFRTQRWPCLFISTIQSIGKKSLLSYLSLNMSDKTDYKFEGWGAFDKNAINGELKWFEYEPKHWEETDVDIKIQYSGICASDLHTMSAGWGEAMWPVVTGHEIVGVAVKVGSKVSHVKVGDIVGVGAQCDSCGECSDACQKDREQYCSQMVGTYNGKFNKEGPAKGDKSYGGYANYNRSPGKFVFKIPDGLDPAFAAPMLCGGATLYNPLTTYGAGKTAKDVGIVGIGGLGSFGLLFAKALGANVTAISHSESKKADAEKMGATRFIATHGGEKDVFKPYERSLDLIVATSNDPDMPLSGYLSLLRPGGNFILVGAPEKPLPQITPFELIPRHVSLGGTMIGSPSQINEMLALAATQDIHPWIIKRSMKEANQAVLDMHAGKARYRYVLVNEENGGKL